MGSSSALTAWESGEVLAALEVEPVGFDDVPSSEIHSENNPRNQLCR